MNDSAEKGFGDFSRNLPTHQKTNKAMCLTVIVQGLTPNVCSLCFKVSADLPCSLGRNRNSQRTDVIDFFLAEPPQ